MRYMQFIYPGPKAETGAMPDEKAIAAMMAYNEELSKAGVLLALDGLHPSAQGARLRREGGKMKVVDGPFTEGKELIGGYWILQVKSKEEALAWASRCPIGEDETLEVRRIFEFSDFRIDAGSEVHAQAERIDAGLGKAKGG
jgi:hypothetical protein